MMSKIKYLKFMMKYKIIDKKLNYNNSNVESVFNEIKKDSMIYLYNSPKHGSGVLTWLKGDINKIEGLIDKIKRMGMKHITSSDINLNTSSFAKEVKEELESIMSITNKIGILSFLSTKRKLSPLDAKNLFLSKLSLIIKRIEVIVKDGENEIEKWRYVPQGETINDLPDFKIFLNNISKNVNKETIDEILDEEIMDIIQDIKEVGMYLKG